MEQQLSEVDALGPISPVVKTETGARIKEDFLAPLSEDTVEIDGGEMYLYDGDTLINKYSNEKYLLPEYLRKEKSNIRIPGYDTSEVSRIDDEGGWKLGDVSAEIQRQEINKIIKELKFNRTIDSGKKDKYGRRLNDLVNDQGMTLSNYLHNERVVGANRWMTNQHHMLRTFGSFADIVNKEGKNLSPGDKARAIVDQVTGKSFERGVFGTSQEVLKGSGLSVKMFQAEINKLTKQIEKEKDPIKAEVLKKELALNRESLTVALNEPPGPLFVRPKTGSGGYRGDPGFWGEIWNSGEKSLSMLENTAAGFTAWTGDLINSNAMQNWGEDWIAETQSDLSEAGFTTDMWSVRNPLDATRFVANTIIQYGPQLGLIYGSTKVGAATGFAIAGPAGSVVGGIAGGISSAFIMAVSSVYQGMPEGEKDPLIAAGIALPISLVDKIGAGIVIPAGTNIFTANGKQTVINAIKKKKPDLSDKEVNDLLNQTTMEVLDAAGLTLLQAAKDQLLAKRTFKDLVSELVKRAGTEGATEAVQEIIQDVGIAATTSKEMDYQNLLYNALESGTIGSIVGGSFATPGVVKQHNILNETFSQITGEKAADRVRESKLDEAMMKHWKGKIKTKRGEKVSDEDVASYYKDKIRNSSLGLERMARAAPTKTRYSDLLSLVKNPIRAVQAYRNYGKEDTFRKDGTYNKHMASYNSLIGALRLYTGVSIVGEQRRLTNNIWSEMPSKQELIQRLQVKNIEEVYQLLKTPENILNPDIREEVLFFRSQLKQMGEQLWLQISNRDIKLGRKGEMDIDPSELVSGEIFLNPNVLDPSKIDERFRELLKNSGGYPQFQDKRRSKLPFTDDMIDSIISGLENGYLSELDRRRLKSIGVFDLDNPDFAPYISRDIFDNALYTVDSFSKDIAMAGKFGNNGQVLAKILEDAYDAGEITKERRDELASNTLDLIAMIKGQYRPIRNKRFKWVQEHVLFASTVTYMDLNFFANMVEFVNGMVGLSSKDLFKYMRGAAKTFFLGVNNDINSATNFATRKVLKSPIGSPKPKRRIEDPLVERLVAAGIVGPKSDINVLEGVNVTSKFYSHLTTLFYKLNLVENQTMAWRAARAALAWDAMLKMVTILEQDSKLGYTTEAGRYARDRLNYYRVDAEFIRKIVKKLQKRNIKLEESIIMDGSLADLLGGTLQDRQDAYKLYEQYSIGIANFTDEFSVRPEPGSTPKVIEDPSLRLFTQFKRFIAHFTANVIPRAWEGYIKRGTPSMTYGTFAIIMGSYGMAMFSQMMKDFITHGEKAPWLEDDEEEPNWLRTSYWRGAAYTGWMGTPSMLIEAIGEYDRNASRMNVFENFYDSTVNQSPALNLINDQIKKGTENVPERVAKVAPFIGGIKPAREFLEELLGKE